MRALTLLTYQSMLDRGKKKKVALIAIMRRMLHVIWALLRSSQPFNPLLLQPSTSNYHPLHA